MKVIADGRRRVTLPKLVLPGDVFDGEQQPGGRLILTKLTKAHADAGKLVRRGGLPLLSSQGPITLEEIRAAMEAGSIASERGEGAGSQGPAARSRNRASSVWPGLRLTP